MGWAILFWQAEAASVGKLPHLSLSMELTLSACFRHQPLLLPSPSGGMGWGCCQWFIKAFVRVLGTMVFAICLVCL